METRNNEQVMPFMAIHPGYILKEELEARKISVSDFSEMTKFPKVYWEEFLNENAPLTEELACLMEKQLGIARDFWWGIYADYLHDSTTTAKRETTLQPV